MPTSAQTLCNPKEVDDVIDWGVVPTMIEGESRTSGVLLHKGPNGESEVGLWICTPGTWECHVTSDEFCHFLEGRCTSIATETAAFFPGSLQYTHDLGRSHDCSRNGGFLSGRLEGHLPGSRDRPEGLYGPLIGG